MTHTLPKITRLHKPAHADSYGIANTPIGFVLTAWQQDMLVRVTILPAAAEKDIADYLNDYGISADTARDDARAKQCATQILFPNGQWTGRFTSPITLGFYGTDFQYAVMRAMNTIPSGKTYSYNALSQKADNSNAARAVGSVCARNPLPLIVPCHRVITSTGALGSYGYGTAMKRQLLQWENNLAHPY